MEASEGNSAEASARSLEQSLTEPGKLQPHAPLSRGIKACDRQEAETTKKRNHRRGSGRHGAARLRTEYGVLIVFDVAASFLPKQTPSGTITFLGGGAWRVCCSGRVPRKWKKSQIPEIPVHVRYHVRSGSTSSQSANELSARWCNPR